MKLVILGAGGYGRTVYDVASQLNLYTDISFLDDSSADSRVKGKCGEYESFIDGETEFYPAFGNNQARLKWIKLFEEKKAVVPVLVHPTAYVSPTVKIGRGTVVLPNATVNTDCVIGKGCIINCGSIVDHGCIIEDGVHICLGAIVKGENRIECCKKIEAGEVVQLRTFPVS